MAIPISELYRLFLERHPTERRVIEEISNKDVIDVKSSTKKPVLTDTEDESRMFNQVIFVESSLVFLSPKQVFNRVLSISYFHH